MGLRLFASALLLLAIGAPAFGGQERACHRRCRDAVQSCLLASPGLSRRDCRQFVWSECSFIGLVGTCLFPGFIDLSVEEAAAISSPVAGEVIVVRLTSFNGAADGVRGNVFSIEAPDGSAYVGDASHCRGWLDVDSSVVCAIAFASPLPVESGTIVFADGHYQASVPFVLARP
jgi:hypothetical protein